MGDDVRTLKDRAIEALEAGRLSDARAAYDQLVKRAPTDPYHWQKRAELLARLGKKAEAVADYEHVVDLYARQSQPLRSVAACRAILGIDPTHTATQQKLAVLFAKHSASIPPPAAPAPVGVPTVGKPARVDTRDLPPIPLFSDLPEDSFTALIDALDLRRVKAGDRIVAEGDVGSAMYILVRGSARVFREVQGKRKELSVLPEGSFFGEMGLLAATPRIATIEAATDSELLVLPRHMYDTVARKFPQVGAAVRSFFNSRLLANVLLANPLFRSFSAAERKALIAKFGVRALEPGELLLEQGAPGRGLYVLLRGSCEVFHRSEDGSQIDYPPMTEGDVFGEISLMLDVDVTVNVRTATRCVLLDLDRASFVELVLPNEGVRAQIDELREQHLQTMITGLADHGIAVDAALLCA